MMLRHSLSWAATCFPEVANGKSLANATIGEIDNFQILFWLCSACWLQRAIISPNANGCQLTTTQLGCFWMVAPCSPRRGESIQVSMPSYNERRWPAGTWCRVRYQKECRFLGSKSQRNDPHMYIIYLYYIVTHVHMLHVYIYIYHRERERKKKKTYFFYLPLQNGILHGWLWIKSCDLLLPLSGAAWYSWDWACTRCEDLENLHTNWSETPPFMTLVKTRLAHPRPPKLVFKLESRFYPYGWHSWHSRLQQQGIPAWRCWPEILGRLAPGVQNHGGFLLLIIKFTIKKTHLYQHLDGFLMNLSSDVLIINHLMVFLW